VTSRSEQRRRLALAPGDVAALNAALTPPTIRSSTLCST
jgi:hypothetical protein